MIIKKIALTASRSVYYLRFYIEIAFGLPKLKVINKRARNDPAYPGLAVASIAVGKKYLSWSLAMIETLRTNGRFYGPVYVFTDQPEFYADVNNVIAVEVPSSTDFMTIQNYKSMLANPIPYDHILYLDVDVMIGRPIKLLLEEIKDFIDKYSIFIFEDRGFSGDKYHAGVFLANRSLASDFMFRWRRSIQCLESKDDQAALQYVLKPDEFYVMPEKHLMFFTPKLLENKEVCTFIHITFRGRQEWYGAEIIMDYLKNVLNVTHLPSGSKMSA